MFQQVFHLVQRTAAAASAVQRWAAFWGPTEETSALMASLLTLASIVALALLAGIAAASLAMLIATLVGLYVLLTDVFGVSVDIAL